MLEIRFKSPFQAALMIVASILVLSSLITLLANFELAKWVKTNGEILSSGIYQQSGHISAEGALNYYYPEIRYTYSLNGIRYESGVVSSSLLAFASEEEAREISEQFTKGKPVDVYISKKDPNHTCLIVSKKKKVGAFIKLAFGLFLLYIGFQIPAPPPKI
jgi:hypothetical protein